MKHLHVSLKARQREQHIKKIFKLTALTFGALIIALGYYITIDPLPHTNVYYKDLFGNIFYYVNNECSGVCIIKPYSPVMFADNKTFKTISIYNTNSLAPLDTDFAKDGTHVFFKNRKIDNAHPQTFRIINDDLGKDDKQYYIGTRPLTEVLDASSAMRSNGNSLSVVTYEKSRYMIINYYERYYYIPLNPLYGEQHLIFGDKLVTTESKLTK